MPHAARFRRKRLCGSRLGSVQTRCELLFAQTWTLLAEALHTYDAPDDALDASRLEPRILLSATPIAPTVDTALVTPVVDEPSTLLVTATMPTAQTPAQPTANRVELVVIDPRLVDSQQLLDQFLAADDPDATFEILVLDASRDGLDQISESLQRYDSVDAIHILSHGTDGRLLVGASLLTENNLDQYAEKLSGWQSWLHEDADILIYGCDVAAGPSGQSFVNRISQLTSADVAASVDATGHNAMGGDWDLEFQIGEISTRSTADSALGTEWAGVLQAITVTTTLDVVDGDTSSIAALLGSRGADGFVSLREAILAANQTAGGDVIFLADGTYTLSITGINETASQTGDLDILDDLEIYGTGASRTIIDAAGIDRVFSVRGAADATLTDLTVRGGNADSKNGGGVSVWDKDSKLRLERTEITSNTASEGGGIYVKDGLVTVTSSTIANNSSTHSGGGIYNENGDLLLWSSAVLQNSAVDDGGGIYKKGAGATLELINVTVSGNNSLKKGGGIYAKDAATILHSTIAYNSSADGGGVFADDPKLFVIQNSILALNSGGNANRILIASRGYNLSNDATSGLTHANDIIVANTGLGVLGNYGGPTQTIAIAVSSAAVDAGVATGATQVDQRGYIRDISADIGAFEYQRVMATGEIQINSTVSSDQLTQGTAVAIDAAGNYVVVWQSDGQDGNGWGVFARRFSARGVALTAEIQVNQFTTGNQVAAQVASDMNGNFVVTWTSELQDGTASSVYARRFAADGTPIDNEFRVNVTSTGSQDSAVIAMDETTGDFVIAWRGQGPGDSDGIFFRRFSADGTSADIADRLANSVDRGAEHEPTIALLSSGGFAIAWSEGASVYLQRFNAAGSAVGGETSIGGLLVTNDSPSLASNSAGNFVLTYRDATLLSGGVRARVFNPDGSVRVTEFSVGTAAGADRAAVTMTDDGTILMTWTENGDSSGKAVLARQFDLNGNPLAAAFRVNVTQSGDQWLGSAAALDSDNFVFVWTGQTAADSRGIVARQYGTALAANTAPVAVDDSYVVNSGGTLQVDAHLNWHDHDFRHRQLLTVALADASAQLVDYPVLVRLHASAVDAVNIDYTRFGSSGQDVRFIDGDGNQLDYQIAKWDPTGYSEVWVKVPLLEADHARNTFYMYYGNPAAVDAQQPAALWDAAFVGVYHLNNTTGSAASAGPGAVSANITYDSGTIAQAAAFDGSSSRIDLGSDAALDDVFAGGGTISAWINPESWGKGNDGRIVDKSLTSDGGGGFVIKIAGTSSGNGSIVFEHDFNGTLGRWRTAPGSVALNSWQQIVVSYDNSNAANVPVIYINGVSQTLVVDSAPVGTAVSDASQNFMIGNYRTPTHTFHGRIDELRIASTILDEAWIVQDYHSIEAVHTTSGATQTRPQGLLRNDSDADKDSLAVSLVSGPSHAAAFTLNADGSFTYQHNGDPALVDSFVYQLSDSQGGISTATVTITTTNQPPTVSAIADRTILEDTPSGAIAFVIEDTESNPDDLSITLSSNNQTLVSDGSLVLSGSGANRSLSFTPQSNATGTATITVAVSDGLQTTNESFTVTVQAVDDAPNVAVIADQTLSEDTPSGAIALVIGDIDTDPDDLIISLTSDNQALIADGAITVAGSGINRSLSFTPQANAAGTATITVSVSDGTSTVSRSFSIDVSAVNDAPSAVADSLNVSTFAATTIYPSQLLANDSDMEGDSLTVQIVTGPKFGTLENLASGDFRYRQTAYTLSGDSFTYRLWDGTAWGNTVTVTLNIAATPIVVVVDAPEPPTAPAEISDPVTDADTPSDSDSTPSDDNADSPDTATDTQVAVMVAMNGNVSRAPSSSDSDVDDIQPTSSDTDTTVNAARNDAEMVMDFESGTTNRGGLLGALHGESKDRGAFAANYATYDITRDALSQPQLWLAMDSMRQEVASSLAMNGGITVGAAATTSVGMTVGYVVWVLRSGLLLSSVMAHLPMWRFMDPLTILDSSEPPAEEDRETLMSIAAGETPAEADDGRDAARSEK
ncbi:MAG: DUF2341 domain-containing protein [Planctomycetaceae bacterium]